MELTKFIGSKELYMHQLAAVEWMMEREKDTHYSGGFLCDEMGLGKTLSVLGLLRNSPVKTTVILCPLAVIGQWIAAAKDAGKGVGWTVYKMEKSWVRAAGKVGGEHCVYICNYDKLLTRKPEFASLVCDRLICDEAHVLRNQKGKKTVALRGLPTKHRWFLTGTPVVNTFGDLCTLMSLLHRAHKAHKAYSIDRCLEWMSMYALARTQEQLKETMADMLPKEPIVHRYKLPFATPEEAVFYRGVQGKLAEELQRLMEAEHKDMAMILVLLMRLRQISVHPQVYIRAKKRQNVLKRREDRYKRADWVGDSTKVAKMVDILRSETESHGYVIFCNFQEEMAILEERLSEESCVDQIFTYSGGMDAAARQQTLEDLEEAVADLKEGPCRQVVLLANLQCGGTGLNLQYLDRVIFSTPWWTAATMDQAAGRVVRLGQRKQVVIHHVILEEESSMSLNIDDFIGERVEKKREACLSALDAANKYIAPGLGDAPPLGEDDEEERLIIPPHLLALLSQPAAPAPVMVLEDAEDPQ